MLRQLNVRVAGRLACLLPVLPASTAVVSRRLYSGSDKASSGAASTPPSLREERHGSGSSDAAARGDVDGDDDHAMDFFDDDLWFLDELMGEGAGDTSTFIPEKDAKLIEREQQQQQQ